MSNKELVEKIQAGALELMGELWVQNKGLIAWKAKQIMTALNLRGNPCGVELDDLLQSGYIALDAAVKTYKTDSGIFSAWLMFYLQSEFANVTGYRTKAEQREPLNNALSLDIRPNGETDEITLGDCIEDPGAAIELERTVEELWRDQLSEALAAGLAGIPQQQADILRLRYFDELTLQDASCKLSISRDKVSQEEHRGLRALRTEALLQFYDFDYYGGTSLTAFRNSGKTVQERYLIEVDRKFRKNG